MTSWRTTGLVLFVAVGMTAALAQDQPAPSGAPVDPLGQFVARVLGSTEDEWKLIFEQSGAKYAPAKLVLYSSVISSACGVVSSSGGPFYCGADKKIYLDGSHLSGCGNDSSCEFANALVIAREVGHHVQNLLGVLDRVTQLKKAVDETEASAWQLRLDLQAQCFAGIWAHRVKSKASLSDDDIDKGLAFALNPRNAASTKALGSLEQRVHWFKIGSTHGTTDKCNTFAASTP